MVIDESRGLHEGIADGGADKVEAVGSKGLAHGAGFFGLGGYVGKALKGVSDGFAVYKAPKELVQRPMLGLDGQDGAGVSDGGGDFGAVADDAGVGAESFTIFVGVGGHCCDVETLERGAVAFAAVQYRSPRESGLRAFEDKEFEERPVVVDGDAPILVVVSLHQRVVSSPFASDHCLTFHAMEAYYDVR